MRIIIAQRILFSQLNYKNTPKFFWDFKMKTPFLNVKGRGLGLSND